MVSDLLCSRTDDLLGGPERWREAQPRRGNTKIGRMESQGEEQKSKRRESPAGGEGEGTKEWENKGHP